MSLTPKMARLKGLRERGEKLKDDVDIPYHHIIPIYGGITVHMSLDTLEAFIEALEARQKEAPDATTD